MLERKGYLRRGDRGSRSLIVERPDRSGSGVVEVPVVGRIAAGRPIEAIEDDRGTIAVDGDLIRGREAYALKVAGESMMEAGILDLFREEASEGDVPRAAAGRNPEG